ncbi:MAG: glycoside hydrolase family 38 C-terminal domain-containing protein [FCB group bacterium]|jgi:alpha-mannosidase/mannosylglycerate hydrolase|nr:glycoside hydrolase family 38 C-terminal domain-containing protein [FCB group bacterium]
MKAFYCVGTHWDREWYEPFQEFRMWLVELIDGLLDLMEKEPEFRVFHLDGQTIVIEDYLRVRPERREQLLKFMHEGRIAAGPWYNLPDEWLISGESFVRNLMKGRRICRDLGVTPLNFAYTPDQFGHIAALPMIMAGFGLEAGIIWRGTQDENYPGHFVWVGPDGSRMVTTKLVDKGSYADFDFLARRPIMEAGFSDESFKEHFEPYIELVKSRTPSPVYMLLDAIDHQAPDPSMLRMVREIKKRYPKVDLKWGRLDEYAAELLKHKHLFEERTGELREPARDAKRVGQYLIVHTISSRYPIKQSNDRCSALMEKWAEPYALMQAMEGGSPILRYLDLAWEYLLKNHPHDSICGCSIDQVHRDMVYRFDQCRQIADGVVRRAVAELGKADEKEDSLRNLVVHNPLPFARKGVFEISVPFPANWPHAYVDGLGTGERLNKFLLLDAEGNRVPFQMRGIDRGLEHARLKSNGRKQAACGDTYHLAVEMELPACGYTGLKLEPTEEATRNYGSLREGPMTATNEFFTFAMNPNGTGDLWHHDSDVDYSDLFLYEDSGDAGDGWTRGPIVADKVVLGPGARVTTAVEEDHALRTVFRVEREFDLPKRMERRIWRRGEEKETLRIVDRIYVEKGAPYLRVRTTVENTCEDHRLRVLFPTLFETAESFADTPFAVVKRDVAAPEGAERWQERVNPEKAFTSFFGVQGRWGYREDADTGLAVLSPFGLHEYAIEHAHAGASTLALTLFRSTWKTVNTAGEPDGELLGSMDFEYFLLPYKGGFDAVAALRTIAEAQAGVQVHHAEAMPETTSFVELEEGHCVVTALKPAADIAGGVVRLWNPGDGETVARLRFAKALAKAERCNLDEAPQEELGLEDGNRVSVTVPARGLATLRFTW